MSILKDFYQIQYDFEKLLVANVPYKVIAFQTDDIFETTTNKIKTIMTISKPEA